MLINIFPTLWICLFFVLAIFGPASAQDSDRRITLERAKKEGELTLYKSTGHAVEDAAAAREVFDRASAEGVGTTFEL